MKKDAGTALAERPAALTDASTVQLKERLTTLLARTADDLREMAGIVGELERRGEDLSALKLGIIDHLRRIASGQLLPEIVVRFAGFPQLLRIAAALPLPDQEKIAAGESLRLAVWQGESVTWRMVEPLALSREQVNQVFAGNRLRTDSEQVAYLEAKGHQSAKPELVRSSVRADKVRGGLVVGRKFVPLGEIIGALAELRGWGQFPGEDEQELTNLLVRVTEAEQRTIKVAAAQSGCTMGDLVRRALWAHGLIGDRHVGQE